MIDTILELHSDIFLLFEEDIMRKSSGSQFCLGDVSTVEQIVCAAIYMEIKKLDYLELAFAQIDSRICTNFINWTSGNPMIINPSS